MSRQFDRDISFIFSRLENDNELQNLRKEVVLAEEEDSSDILSAHSEVFQSISSGSSSGQYPNSVLPNGQSYESLVEAMSHPLTGVKVKTHFYHLKPYPNTFIGYEAVDWLVKYLKLEDRGQAVKIGQTLMFQGFITHSCNSEAFADHFFFYYFMQQVKVERCTFPPEMLSLYDEYKLSQIVDMMASSRDLNISKRRFLFLQFEDCFTGAEAVAWFVKNKSVTHCQNRHEGVQLGKLLLDRGALHHVLNKHHFTDSNYLYRLYHMEERYNKMSQKSSIQTLFKYLNNHQNDTYVDSEFITDLIARLNHKSLVKVFIKQHPLLDRFFETTSAPYSYVQGNDIGFNNLSEAEFISIIWKKLRSHSSSHVSFLGLLLFVYCSLPSFTLFQSLFIKSWLSTVCRQDQDSLKSNSENKNADPFLLELLDQISISIIKMIRTNSQDQAEHQEKKLEKQQRNRSLSPSIASSNSEPISPTGRSQDHENSKGWKRIHLTFEIVNTLFKASIYYFIIDQQSDQRWQKLLTPKLAQQIKLEEVSSKMPNPVTTMYALTRQLMCWRTEEFRELINVFKPNEFSDLSLLKDPSHKSNQGVLGIFLLEVLFTVVNLNEINGQIRKINLPLNSNLLISIINIHPEIQSLTCFFLKEEHLSILSEIKDLGLREITINNIVPSPNISKVFTRFIANCIYLEYIDISSIKNTELELLPILYQVSETHETKLRALKISSPFGSNGDTSNSKEFDIQLIKKTLNKLKSLEYFSICCENNNINTNLFFETFNSFSIRDVVVQESMLTSDTLISFFNINKTLENLDLTTCTFKLERLKNLVEPSSGAKLEARINKTKISLSWALLSKTVKCSAKELSQNLSKISGSLEQLGFELNIVGKPHIV